MKKKRIRILAALVLAAALLLTAGCKGPFAKDGSKGSSSNGKTKVTLNEVAHSIFYAPLYVAIEEGYFEEEGIELTLITGFGVI